MLLLVEGKTQWSDADYKINSQWQSKDLLVFMSSKFYLNVIQLLNLLMAKQ